MHFGKWMKMKTDVVLTNTKFKFVSNICYFFAMKTIFEENVEIFSFLLIFMTFINHTSHILLLRGDMCCSRRRKNLSNSFIFPLIKGSHKAMFSVLIVTNENWVVGRKTKIENNLTVKGRVWTLSRSRQVVYSDFTVIIVIISSWIQAKNEKWNITFVYLVKIYCRFELFIQIHSQFSLNHNLFIYWFETENIFLTDSRLEKVFPVKKKSCTHVYCEEIKSFNFSTSADHFCIFHLFKVS